jgi:hypothetical protein
MVYRLTERCWVGGSKSQRNDSPRNGLDCSESDSIDLNILTRP